MKKFIAGFLVMVLCLSAGFAQGGNETKSVSADEPKVITIWYEGGDARLPFFKEVEKEMQKDHPNISINAVTFDNATFMTKVLQATTATGGVDLVFNDASRILTINQQSGGGFEDLSDVMNADPNKGLVTAGDLKLSSSSGKLIVYPVNRSIAALGVKTDVKGVDVNENTLPKTWEKFIQLGQAYKKAGLAGFTMHLGSDPGQSFNLFICGAGHDDVWLNSTPTCEIDNKIDSFEKIVKVYAGNDGFWDKDAISEGFAEMYNKILSSSVGMFRVGNWNAGPWDKPDSGAGEYVTTTWPALQDGDESGLVLLNTRGLAMPKNSKNKEAAKIFLSYVLKTASQTKSFETMGSCIDLSVVDTTKLTKNQKIFFDPEVKLFPIDTYVAEYEFYPELNDIYEKGLNRAINAKEEDVRNVLLDLNTQIDKAISANK